MTEMSVNNFGSSFQHNLILKLALEADGQKMELHSSEITEVILNLHPYGFDGSLEFNSVKNDQLDQFFAKPKVIKAQLTFNALDPKKQTDPIFEIKGIVTNKYLKRIDSAEGVEDEITRLYQIDFSDNAKVTWSRHFPINIYVDESMKNVLEKHKNPEVDITYNFPELEKQYPILAFSLEHKASISEMAQSSFYSLLHWYLQQQNGIWEYDYKTHKYSIQEKKQDKEKPFSIYDRWISPPKYNFSEIVRYNSKVIKHNSDSTSPEDKENQNTFKQVRQEHIDFTNYSSFPEQVSEKVQSDLHSQFNELDIEVLDFENEFHIDKLLPGSLVSFMPNQLLKGAWSHDPLYKDQTFRVRHLIFRASQSLVPSKAKGPNEPYQLRIRSLLEKKEELFVQRPTFVPPNFPFSIQGKVFSDIGEKEQSTYKIAESEQFPQGHYVVEVPLAGEGKKVVVPFFPDFMTGQYYFPLCKGERVLLSIYFRTAKIQRTIDWQPLARLPVGVQGNQIVFASNGKDKYTIMKHEFENGKDLVFTVKQSSSDTQTQTISVREKDIIVTIDEKDKKTISVHLNGDLGLLLTLEDKTANLTQQTTFDGKAMTHICKGEKTSTIVQKPDSISIDCDNFTVTSKKIILDAKESISQTGKNKVSIETNMASVAAPTVKLGS